MAWLVQTQEAQERTGASDEDGDGLVNYPMACGEVEACAFFKETAPGSYRVSLRSKGDVNVARIAERFGGGGHRNAAGATIEKPIADVRDAVLQALRDGLREQHGAG